MPRKEPPRDPYWQNTRDDLRAFPISQEDSDAFTQSQMYALLNRIGARRALRRFHEDYSVNSVEIFEKAGSGRINRLIPREYRDIPGGQDDQRITYALYSSDPFVVLNRRRQSKEVDLSIRVVVNSREHYSPAAYRDIAFTHSIGETPQAQSGSLDAAILYSGDAVGISYRKIRRKLNRELKKFARENNLVKTLEARKRDLRKKIAAGGAIIGAVGTGIKFGSDIIQFAQRIGINVPNLPHIPFLP